MGQLNWKQTLIDLGDGQTITVSQAVLALSIVVVGFVLSRLISKIIGHRLRSGRYWADAAHVAEKMIFIVLLIAVVLTAMRTVHIPITAFAFLGGAIAIGVGFGAQNIINNFISGWILLTEKPIRVGDVLQLDDKHGRVETIGPRCTRIRRTDGIDALVPNSKILENTVVNWTLIDKNVRTIMRVGVAYGSPVERVIELLYQVAEEDSEVLEDPGPIVIFEDFGDSALVFDLYFWTEASVPMQIRKTAGRLRTATDRIFHENNITIAFPQRDIHLDTHHRPLEVRLLSTDSQA
ncbi:MAG: mechanosensitive ion channel [Phycisphaeraceae bacterium]|nr:mechanosensitive ion channel [Phycisphaeraceae bacterium]